LSPPPMLNPAMNFCRPELRLPTWWRMEGNRWWVEGWGLGVRDEGEGWRPKEKGGKWGLSGVRGLRCEV